jgi:hypothetical protein
MILRISTVLLLLAVSLWAWASAASESPLLCVDEISFPVFDHAIAYYLPAEAHVRVAIGSRDGEHSVTLDPPNTPLKLDLMDAFGSETRYSASCKGKVLDFDVRYVVQGQRTVVPSWQVRFRPPNQIIVVTHPVKGSVN